MKKLACLLALLISVPASAIDTLVEEDHNFPLVFISVAARSGAAQDPADKQGLTNFMGEMLKRGTKKKTKDQIDFEIDAMGAQVDIDTRGEAMIIRGAVLASELDRFLALVTELLSEPSFPEAEMKKLKSELSAGIMDEQGHDSSLATRRFSQFLFGTHPYSRTVIGTVKGIEAIQAADVKAHYEKHFHAGNLIVLASGDITPAKVSEWTAALEKLRPAQGGATPAPETPVDSEGRRLMIVDKPARTQTQIRAGWIGLRPDDPDYFAAYIGNFVLGGPTFNSRLVKEVRVKRGWTYGINSGYRPARRPNLWYVGVFPAAENTADALGETIHQVELIRSAGVTEDEFKFAQDSLINSDGFRYNTTRKRVENALLEKTLDLPAGFLKAYASNFASVTRDQVNAALKKHFKPEKLNVVVVGTADKLKAPLAKAVGIPVEQVVVKPYTVE